MSDPRNGRRRAKRRHGWRLLKKQDSRCCYCGTVIVLTFHFKAVEGRSPPSWLATIEHITPLSEGGTNHFNNLALSCYACNQERNNEALERRSSKEASNDPSESQREDQARG